MILSDIKHYKVSIESVVIDHKDVEVVNSFNLLGVLLDNNLKFKDYVSKIKKTINIKLFSIKKLQFIHFLLKFKFNFLK